MFPPGGAGGNIQLKSIPNCNLKAAKSAGSFDLVSVRAGNSPPGEREVPEPLRFLGKIQGTSLEYSVSKNFRWTS